MRWPALAMVVGVAALTLAGCVGNTDPATNVSDTGAKLNAHGHTNNGPAYWWWEYAASASDLGTASDVEVCGDNKRCGPASASSDVPLSTNVAGLKPETTYYFRVCGQDQVAGSVPACGRTLSFKTLAFAPHIYWAEDAGGDNKTISRANLDGTGVDRSFITVGATPLGVAVDRAHVYWVNNYTGKIGRANRDGSGVKKSFISFGSKGGAGVAVDAKHIYWSDNVTGTIGRANLDGSAVNPSFIIGANATGVAVNSTHIYWANGTAHTIDRANLDGTGKDSFISGVSGSQPGVAVDDTHVYWAQVPNFYNGPIGRANLDGSGLDSNFTGDGYPLGLAIDGAHIYATQGGSIGRANLLDGSGWNHYFIRGSNFVSGVAVDR
jgi:hypothetical protein